MGYIPDTNELYYEPLDEDVYIIRTTDNPGAIKSHRSVYFDTILIAINYNSTGKDVVIGSFQWSSENGGEYTSIDDKLAVGFISDNAKKILKHDYPSYKYQV